MRLIQLLQADRCNQYARNGMAYCLWLDSLCLTYCVSCVELDQQQRDSKKWMRFQRDPLRFKIPPTFFNTHLCTIPYNFCELINLCICTEQNLVFRFLSPPSLYCIKIIIIIMYGCVTTFTRKIVPFVPVLFVCQCA